MKKQFIKSKQTGTVLFLNSEGLATGFDKKKNIMYFLQEVDLENPQNWIKSDKSEYIDSILYYLKRKGIDEGDMVSCAWCFLESEKQADNFILEKEKIKVDHDGDLKINKNRIVYATCRGEVCQLIEKSSKKELELKSKIKELANNFVKEVYEVIEDTIKNQDTHPQGVTITGCDGQIIERLPDYKCDNHKKETDDKLFDFSNVPRQITRIKANVNEPIKVEQKRI